MRTVEAALSALPAVLSARANLTTRRVRVVWRSDREAPPLIDTLGAKGFDASILDDGRDVAQRSRTLSRHLRALAVSGFAAGNVMMLSVSVWSGADETTRTLFHALSAAIALPALAYAGRLFFQPAWRALRHGHVNMDVPISIGVLATIAMSLYDTLTGGHAVYFDAALMLVFFLLVGRTLDQRMRDRARDAADAVSRFEPTGADVIGADGRHRFTALDDLGIGDRLCVPRGVRLAVDAVVESGDSYVDRSLVTGESVPVHAATGAELHAGTLNLGEPLIVRATSAADDSFIARIRTMMQDAEATKGRYRRLADRAAAHYAPVVHAAAASTLIGWWCATGDLHRATSIAVAVLIITCPCALGLAVPVVQVIAARRLFDTGVLMKDGAALERMAGIDTAVFDKTGTLTTGQPEWTHQVPTQGAPSAYPDAHEALALARALASKSTHPHARALMHGPVAPVAVTIHLDACTEVAGHGLEARLDGSHYRLGRADWALDAGTATAPIGIHEAADASAAADAGPLLDELTRDSASTSLLARDGQALAIFRFRDRMREDARPCLERLKDLGIAVEMLSGDAPTPVADLAHRLDIASWRSGVLPAEKVAHVEALEATGRPILMIGDGVNDSPALMAASVSMSLASAADIGRRSADFLLLQDRLAGVPTTIELARRAKRLVQGNMALAIAYNLCAMPLAVAGYVTPLVAALSMSLSSVLVIANALRLSARSNDESHSTTAASVARRCVRSRDRHA